MAEDGRNALRFRSVMRIRVLGTAAGGGFPQWNCNCHNCREARTNPAGAHPRTQSSIAISADGERWFLLNASPDLAAQIAVFPPLQPTRFPIRGTPIEAVLLTNADLDHTLGLLSLRENPTLSIYASPETRSDLTEGSAPLSVLGKFCTMRWFPVSLTEEPLLQADGSASLLSYMAFPVPGKPPKFARRSTAQHGAGDSVGYRIRDTTTGGTLIYAPDVLDLSGGLATRLDDCDLLFFDGTFWSETEMSDRKINDVTARDMGHLPISGSCGSLEGLKTVSRPSRIYIHINNTNPILLETSPERAAVRAAGWTVGEDGMEFQV